MHGVFSCVTACGGEKQLAVLCSLTGCSLIFGG